MGVFLVMNSDVGRVATNI